MAKVLLLAMTAATASGFGYFPGSSCGEVSVEVMNGGVLDYNTEWSNCGSSSSTGQQYLTTGDDAAGIFYGEDVCWDAGQMCGDTVEYEVHFNRDVHLTKASVTYDAGFNFDVDGASTECYETNGEGPSGLGRMTEALPVVAPAGYDTVGSMSTSEAPAASLPSGLWLAAMPRSTPTSWTASRPTCPRAVGQCGRTRRPRW